MVDNGSAAFAWVDGRRDWWTCAEARRYAKLRRALLQSGSDSRSLMAYDIVNESVRDGPKGYVVIGRRWLPELHQRMVQHVTLAQCALSYDGLYEVVSGTKCC